VLSAYHHQRRTPNADSLRPRFQPSKAAIVVELGPWITVRVLAVPRSILTVMTGDSQLVNAWHDAHVEVKASHPAKTVSQSHHSQDRFTSVEMSLGFSLGSRSPEMIVSKTLTKVYVYFIATRRTIKLQRDLCTTARRKQTKVVSFMMKAFMSEN
jgi:hypothetical protein